MVGEVYTKGFDDALNAEMVALGSNGRPVQQRVVLLLMINDNWPFVGLPRVRRVIHARILSVGTSCLAWPAA